MSAVAKNQFNKDEIIDALLNNNIYKMSDGRQFYEATVPELIKELCLNTDHSAICDM